MERMAVGAMGGVTMSEQLSLERLKALDSLPNLPSQLAEANRLCTHSARADMIAKWLLEKLNKSREVRANLDAWQSLASTLRLLSSERLASLLTANNFISTTITALEEISDPTVIFHSIARVVNFLLEVSAGPNGTPVKALLSLPFADAARLLGIWLQNAVNNRLTTVGNTLQIDHHAVLRTGITIWHLRKQSANENEAFAAHCLIPLAFLITAFSSETATVIASSKRMASGVDDLKDDIVKEIETLLARHIFLPSRTAFFNAPEATTRNGQDRNESLNQSSILETLLQPLKSADLELQCQLKALPLLLDIALRCVSTPTPRQRTKEKPWIEAVFQALHDCNKHKNTGHVDRGITAKMLQAIAAHANLSQETLKRLVWDHSILSISHDTEDWWKLCTAEHWTIIAQVLKMDADIFAEPALAGAIFTWLSKTAQRNLTEHAEEVAEFGDAPSTDAEISRWRIQWLDEILVPIMKAFTRRRKLQTFIDLWLEELEQEPKNQAWSAWVELDSYLYPELEASMTEAQIIELFDRLSQRIVAESLEEATEYASGAERVSALMRRAGPNIVILNGILQPYLSESLSTAISAKCERLFSHIIDLWRTIAETTDTSYATSIQLRRSWSLLRRAFESWFPSWLEKRSDQEDVSKKCGWLPSEDAVVVALWSAKDTRSNVNASPAAISEAVDAEYLVASICFHLMTFRESLGSRAQEDLTKLLSDLIGQLDPASLQALCRYEDVFLLIHDTQIRSTFLEKCFTAAASPLDVAASISAREALQALLATVVTHSQTTVLDDFVRVALKILDGGQFSHGDRGEWERSDRISIATELLLQIPVTTLTRLQREKILDVLSKRNTKDGLLSEKSLRRRLALMVKLMEVPNASSQLSIDHAILWQAVLSVNATEYAELEEDSPDFHEEVYEFKTVEFAGELARLVVKHLLATQDQERSRSTLLQLSEDSITVLESCCKRTNMTHWVLGLVLSKSIVQELEAGAKDSLRQQLPHRNAQTAEFLLENLSEVAKEMMSNADGVHSEGLRDGNAAGLDVTLNTLPVMLELVSSILTDNALDLMTRAVKGLTFGLDNLREHGDDRIAPSSRSALFRCFAIGCKHAPIVATLSLATSALQLLRIKAQAPDIKAITDAFESLLARLDSASRARLTDHIFLSLRTEQPGSLLLLQACLGKIEKDDYLVHEDDILSPSRFLPTLLRLTSESNDIPSQERAMSCLMILLKQKAFFYNQHAIDSTLSSLPDWLRRTPSDSQNFLDVCRILSALLLNHRARLQGRFHLVNYVYMALISKLFSPHKENTPHPTHSKPLGPEYAYALSRSLMLFCEPLQLRRQGNTAGLTDESRREQAHVGRYIPNVLHYYCSEVLTGSMADGVSEALKPGLRSVIEAIEMNDADGVRYLSSCMNNSERAVLRNVYDDWRRFGKWREGG